MGAIWKENTKVSVKIFGLKRRCSEKVKQKENCPAIPLGKIQRLAQQDHKESSKQRRSLLSTIQKFTRDQYLSGETTNPTHSVFKDARIRKEPKSSCPVVPGCRRSKGNREKAFVSVFATEDFRRSYSPVALVEDRRKRGHCIQYSKYTGCSCLF